MFKPDELEKNNYFEQKEEIDYQIKQHKSSIEYMRKYQEVAKGRQEIVQAMLLAGAEREQIDIALRNYADAMSLLRYYANVPDVDIEHRRLKVAQESLARARVRADTYLQKLKSGQMDKESALEMQTQEEYEAYLEGKKIPSSSAPIPQLTEKEDLSKIKGSLLHR